MDRTLLSLKALTHIFYRMTQKVDYEKSISEIKVQIHNKGLEFANHLLHTHTLIDRFA